VKYLKINLLPGTPTDKVSTSTAANSSATTGTAATTIGTATQNPDETQANTNINGAVGKNNDQNLIGPIP
jgi:hypothetical protein